METHAHHIHKAPGNGWKHYFFEFLMLFLAVFCGFLAENYREHVVEHKKEKQYIESMIADMKDDSNKIQNSIDSNSIKLLAMDTLLQNIYQITYTDSTLRMMYYLQRRYTHSRYDAQFTKRTITQLKNSGALRLVRNNAAADSIVIYDELCEKAEKQAENYSIVQIRVQDLSIKIFDSQYLLNYNRWNVIEFLKTDTKVVLLNNDGQLLKEYANSIYIARGLLTNYVSMLKRLQGRIPGTIQFLQKEYHLE